jgi:alkylation response protein AidB-like acyl-CoA dehydrogenase
MCIDSRRVWWGGGTLAHDFAIFEAQASCGDSGFGNQVHSGLVAHYLLTYGTDQQKRRWPAEDGDR